MYSRRIVTPLVTLLLFGAFGPAPVLAGNSPGTARALSILLPGAGHLYAGETVTGLELLAAFASTATLAIATNPGTWESKDENSDFPELSEGTPTTTKLIFWGSAAAAAVTWIYAVVDAPKAIERRLAFRLEPAAGDKSVMFAVQVTL